MKLWKETAGTDKLIEKFTVGQDRELDLTIASHDVVGSLAHVKMLKKAGLLHSADADKLVEELRKIYREIEDDDFIIPEPIEDIHSRVEVLLTERLGDAGKKIHMARSRNDQVMVDLRLFSREGMRDIVKSTHSLFNTLMQAAEEHKDVIIPGYTHMQIAMPSSFGLWFSAYAESLTDDLVFLNGIYQIINRNPLGSGAGYGTNLPIDRRETTRLLGFADLNYNSVYAQMGRGRTEWHVATGLSSIAGTLNKLASDLILFTNQNFGLVTLPEAFTTGSSIMPHKRNPDVFELVRGRTAQVRSAAITLQQMTTNLTSGYFRDFQLLKEVFLPCFSMLQDCISIMDLALSRVTVNDHVVDGPEYDHLFTVERVNELVQDGTPFRDAYRQVSDEVQNGNFVRPEKARYTHEGSIGNLCLAEIRARMERSIEMFDFNNWEKAINKLITGD